MGIEWYLIIILIRIFLITNEAAHFHVFTFFLTYSGYRPFGSYMSSKKLLGGIAKVQINQLEKT